MLLLLLLVDSVLIICNLGTSNNCSNNIEYSATSSASNCRSQFSEAVSEIVEEGEGGPDGQILETPNLKVFTFAELKTATKNFKGDTLLGEGGFGRVYKGWVDEKSLTPSKIGTGMIVAIKKLNHESVQGFEEWQVAYSLLNFLSILAIFTVQFILSIQEEQQGVYALLSSQIVSTTIDLYIKFN